MCKDDFCQETNNKTNNQSLETFLFKWKVLASFCTIKVPQNAEDNMVIKRYE